MCVRQRERENGGETELHTVHIDPAFVMVMLQSLDPAPGLEIYSVKSIFVQSAETNCTYLCCCVLRWRLTRVPPEQYNFVSQDFIGRNSMSKLSWKCRHAHVIKSTLFFFPFWGLSCSQWLVIPHRLPTHNHSLWFLQQQLRLLIIAIIN